MDVLQPPTPLPAPTPGRPSLFLAGSIEMGRATRWQDTLIEQLRDLDLLVFNPRRDAWDASWEQRSDNPVFRAQVDWELDALEQATLVVLYLDPATTAPISLLELGLFARSGKVIVCCPDGYFRKGNVDIVCQRHGIPQAATLADLVTQARARLR
jgi:hypothetical protein